MKAAQAALDNFRAEEKTRQEVEEKALLARAAEEASRRTAEEDKARLATELRTGKVAQDAKEKAEQEAARLATELAAMTLAYATREKLA